jgi:hypothetical protein
MSLRLFSIATCAIKPGKAFRFHSAGEDGRAFLKNYSGFIPHYGMQSTRMLLKEQTGKECFILTAALSVTGGFVMTIFPKKKIVVPTVARNDSIK